MKLLIKILIACGIALMFPSIVNAQISVVQGGTGLSSVPFGYCLEGNATLHLIAVPCGSTGGAGTWATTTSSVPAWLYNYSNNTTDIILVGGTSTSTAKFIFDPNSQIGYFSQYLGINTKSPQYNLEVNGTASTSQLYGSSLATCNGSSFLQWTGGLFGCGAGSTSSFSTTSANYWIGQYPNGNLFSTTSANNLASVGGYLNSNTGNWAGTWQGNSPSAFQAALTLPLTFANGVTSTSTGCVTNGVVYYNGTNLSNGTGFVY